MKKALLIAAAAILVTAVLVRVQLVAREPAEPTAESSSADKIGDLFAEPAQEGPGDNPAPDDTPVLGVNAGPAGGRGIFATAQYAYAAALAAYQAETTTLESVYLWSSRWLAAELSVAQNWKDQIGAAEAHLERMRKLQKKTARMYEIGTRGGEAFELASANFYVADAKRKLAELKSQPRRPVLPDDAFHEAPLTAPKAVRPVPMPNAVPKPAVPKAAPNGFVPAVPPQASPYSPAQPYPAPPPRAAAPPASQYGMPPTDPYSRPAAPGSAPSPTFEKAPLDAVAPPDDAKLPLSPPTKPSPFEPRDLPVKQGLLYDGKSFNEWAHLLQTDLSPSVRREALEALGEFAANGFGQQSVEVVFDTMRNYSVWTMDNSPDGKMKEAAIQAVRKAPPDDVLPFITSAMKSNNSNLKLFALRVLPVDRDQKKVVPLLELAMHDKDGQVVAMARPLMALADHDNAALVDWLQATLADRNSNDLAEAIRLLGRGEVFVTGMRSFRVAPYPDLIPKLVSLLDHDDAKIRHLAANAIRQLGRTAVPALEQESSKSSTATTSQRAGQLLDQILSPLRPANPDAEAGFDWE